jgi:UDP-galactose transporter B1
MTGLRGESNIWGIVCLLVALFFDGWLAYDTDNVKVTYEPGAVYMTASINFYTAVLSFACNLLHDLGLDCAIVGELHSGTIYLLEHPQLLPWWLVYGAVSVAGNLCTLATIDLFGSLVKTMLTTTRKFISLMLSLYIFQHNCTFSQYCALLIVFATVAYDIYKEHCHESPASASDLHPKKLRSH